MTRLQSSSVTLSIPIFPTSVLVLGNSPRRIRVIVTLATNGTVRFGNREMPASGPLVAYLNGGIESVLKYEDWGSVIQDEIWLGSLGAAITGTVTAISLVG